MVAVSGSLAFGVVLGFGAGLLAGPLIRSWLVWHEAEAAGREADLVRGAPDGPDGPGSHRSRPREPWPDRPSDMAIGPLPGSAAAVPRTR
jgi:hypothetical protein